MKTDEAKKMARSASLITYPELRRFLTRRQFHLLLDEHIDPAEAVAYARRFAYEHVNFFYGRARCKMIEALTKGLDEAGFIRHDLAPRDFYVGRLYQAVYGDAGVDARYNPSSIEDLCECEDAYEYFQAPSPKLISTINAVMSRYLTAGEQFVLAYRFGLEDGRECSNGEIAQRLHGEFGLNNAVDVELRARKALQKLRDEKVLPSIMGEAATVRYNLSEDSSEYVQFIISELAALRRSPIHLREELLLRELARLSGTPYRQAQRIEAYLYDGKLDGTPIEHLGLSDKTRECLWRAGICTVADIAKLQTPEHSWLRIRGLRDEMIREIQAAMHRAGYTAFRIDLYPRANLKGANSSRASS